MEVPKRLEHFGDSKLESEWENVSSERCLCDGQIVARREKSGDLFLGKKIIFEEYDPLIFKDI